MVSLPAFPCGKFFVYFRVNRHQPFTTFVSMADLPPPPAPVVGEVVEPAAAAPVAAEAGELAAPPVVEAEVFFLFVVVFWFS